jgi:DNA-binding NarL/FixJ family response regulator
MGRDTKTLRILLADDHPLLLAGVREVLARGGDFEIVGEATHGSEVLPLVAQRLPDVVLLDLRLPGLDGHACLQRIRTQHPGVDVVVFSMRDDPTDIEAAFRRGASGYVLKTIDPRDLAAAIRQSVQGTAYHAQGLTWITDLPPAGDAGALSERELDVVRAVARGLSNRDVGKELWISEQTVKFHLTNVYRKLNLHGRVDAVRWALDAGLLSRN